MVRSAPMWRIRVAEGDQQAAIHRRV